MFRPMLISGLTVDPLTNSPIVILKEIDGERTLPIWIGLLEATAIASELEGIKFSRPMTHDLLKNIMAQAEIKVNKVEVCDLKNNTFFANIHLLREGQNFVIDARPSDAIALALRAGAQIFVDDQVIEKSRSIDFGAKATDLDKLKDEKLKEFLENLSPEEFGKYKM